MVPVLSARERLAAADSAQTGLLTTKNAKHNKRCRRNAYGGNASITLLRRVLYLYIVAKLEILCLVVSFEVFRGFLTHHPDYPQHLRSRIANHWLQHLGIALHGQNDRALLHAIGGARDHGNHLYQTEQPERELRVRQLPRFPAQGDDEQVAAQHRERSPDQKRTEGRNPQGS